ncbi:MAG: hypothetical protein AAGI45_17185 [Cyanobacteria bacterium P01_H01_bin.26]
MAVPEKAPNTKSKSILSKIIGILSKIIGKKLGTEPELDEYSPDPNLRRLRKIKIQRKLQKYFYIFLCTAIFLPLMVVAILVQSQSLSNPLYILSGIAYSMVPIMLFVYSGLELRKVEREIQELSFEIDLLRYGATKQESHAEKLFQINKIQLRQYYDLNVNQSIWVFCLGIFCIFIGVLITGTTLFLLLQVADDTETKIIAGAVGAISSLLVNYVAAIYLKIHAEAASNFSSFHSRLVDTQKILLANLLVSRIEDEAERWKIISQLAINVSEQKGD